MAKNLNIIIILTIPSAREDREQLKPSYIASKNAKWYSQFKK